MSNNFDDDEDQYFGSDLARLDLLKIISDHYPEFDGVHPACLTIPMIDQLGFDEMIEDIQGNGLRHSLLRTKDRLLLDGKVRLLACYVVGQEIHVKDDSGIVDPWQQVYRLNLCRRSLTPSQVLQVKSEIEAGAGQ